MPLANFGTVIAALNPRIVCRRRLLHNLSLLDGEHAPSAGYALEFVFAAIGESDAGSSDQWRYRT